MTKKDKIAVFELTTYHEECLYTQLKFLVDGGYAVTLITHPKNEDSIRNYKLPLEVVCFYDPRACSFIGKRIAKWYQLFKFIAENSFRKVLFNTASSNKETIAFVYLLPNNIKRYGVLHNLSKVDTSWSQKIISKKITQYFVLNNFLKHSLSFKNKTLKLEAFYPIFFPEYKSVALSNEKISPWICIPGELNYKRRNYDLVLDALINLDPKIKLKIIILGKMNQNRPETASFVKKVKLYSLENKLITFTNFIENNEFHAYLKTSDYILAPVTLNEKKYISSKITGAYNLAFAHKKTLICPQELQVIPDLNANAYFYQDVASLANLFTKIASGTLGNRNDYEHTKWQYETQKQNFLQVLE